MSTHAKPRAYEPHRLLDAIHQHARVLIMVGLVGMFGGAAAVRWLVPDLTVARAIVHIGGEPHVMLAPARQGVLMRAALARAGLSDAAALGERMHVTFRGDQLVIEARGLESQAGRTLAHELATGYVAFANGRVDAQRADQRAAHAAELAAARERRERARLALERELSPARAEREATLNAQVAELDAALQRATLQPAHQASNSRELADAQRSLSRLLAQGTADARVNELRTKIDKLQRASENPTGSLSHRLASKRAELSDLIAADARLQPLRTALDEADARVNRLAAHVEPALDRSVLEGPVQVETISRRPLRVSASLLAPLLALSLLVGFLLLRALLGLRVSEATEVAHWLQVPVLTSSSWPHQNEALEALVDALADPALESLGTTLVLPLSEIERPLAYTLTAQLNTRAQRYYRSRTGSRVTIAQEWQGALDSSRIERAAEAADRVLWVVAADTHRGTALAARRALIRRTDGVAAVLLDAEPAVARSVGAVREFWNARTHLPESIPDTTPQLPSY